MLRVLAAVLLAVCGMLTAIASVALHQRWWGLLLAWAATSVVLVALPPRWWSRLAFAVGWAGLVAWVAAPRPEGDYAISQDVPGMLLLALGLLVVLLGVATLPRPRRGDS